MKLVKSTFEFMDVINGFDVLKRIELAGRVCYKSEDKITTKSSLKFVADIIKRGHESVLEHEKVTVRVICDRGVSHEIVRHRIASYSQESTRYCDYNKGRLTFIIPSFVKDVDEGEYDLDKIDQSFALENLSPTSALWFSSMVMIAASYKALRASGCRPEEARSILPNSLKTEVVMTMNLREWRHFFKLRTSKAAHPDMRDVAVPMLAEFIKCIPIVFDDLLMEAL